MANVGSEVERALGWASPSPTPGTAIAWRNWRGSERLSWTTSWGTTNTGRRRMVGTATSTRSGWRPRSGGNAQRGVS